MISPNRVVSERQRLERIAEEYRAKGYDVQVEPGGSDLPPFLIDHHPDLIARRGDERLVIEVKPPSSGEPFEVHGIAESIKKEAGWRLVLIAASPAEELVPGERLPLLSATEIERHQQEASRLLSEGQEEAALLLAWAAVEAQLRSQAKQEEIPLPRPDTQTLLRQMVSLGLVDRDQHKILNEAFRARGVVAHGFRAEAEIHAMVRSLLDLSAILRQEFALHAS